ncbi:type 4a pilus biogenesis protein PilO [Patescibacteria group bacterium]|nr:type 4a pilus biogenesis protein PilO [Patescibacteria group bacterium]
MNIFYKNLLRHNIFYLLGILALAGILFFLKVDIKNSVLEITQKRNALAVRTNSLSSTAELEADFKQASSYFSLLDNILPSRDNLLLFSKEIEDLAVKNKLEFGFTFGVETLANEKEPGSLCFRMVLTGSYDSFVSFLKDIETSRYFMNFNNIDITKKGDGFSGIINGTVFFR